MADKIIQPFTDIPIAPVEDSGQKPVYLSDLRELNVGQGGSKVFRADKQGIWLGGETFDVATFSVAMDGSITAGSLTLVAGTVRYGKTSFTDTANAGYFIGPDGVFFGNAGDTKRFKYNISAGTLDYIGTLSNSAGAAVLDSGAVTILKGFTFSPTDYSGALKTGDVTWNTTTGAITGGSGILINKDGIVGVSAGVVTFFINGTTGSASFSGTITGSTITGGTIRTASSGNRIVMTSGAFKAYNAANDVTLDLDSNSASQVLIVYTPTADDRIGINLHIDGTGNPLLIQSDNASNASTLLSIISAGTGIGLSLDLNNTASTSPAIAIANSGLGVDITFSTMRATTLLSEVATNATNDILAIRNQLWTCQNSDTEHWLPFEMRGFTYRTSFDSLDNFQKSDPSYSNGLPSWSGGNVTLPLRDNSGGGPNTVLLKKTLSINNLLTALKPRYCRFDMSFSSVDYHQGWGMGMGEVTVKDYNGGTGTIGVGSFFALYPSGTNWYLYAVQGLDGTHGGLSSIGNNYFTAGQVYTFEILVLPANMDGAGDNGETYFYIDGVLVATLGNPVGYQYQDLIPVVLNIQGENTDHTVKHAYISYWDYWHAV